MTAHQKKIRAEWQSFKNKQKIDNKIFISGDEITKVMSKLFG